MIRHICDLLRRPDLRPHHWSWNGIVWEHSLVFMRRGDVITVRPHKSALFTAPTNLLRLRVVGVQVLLLELTGPSLPDADPSTRTAIQLTTSQIRGHWPAVCAATEPLFGDRREFSKVLLLVFGIPPIRCSARTRLPPTEQQMQSAYDLHLAPIFGPREWLDTGQIDGEHCIFVDANSQGHRQRPWLVTLGYGHEAYLADDQGLGLADAPTPLGTRLRPVWYSTHFGRATMCDASAPDSHSTGKNTPIRHRSSSYDLTFFARPHHTYLQLQTMMPRGPVWKPFMKNLCKSIGRSRPDIMLLATLPHLHQMLPTTTSQLSQEPLLTTLRRMMTHLSCSVKLRARHPPAARHNGLRPPLHQALCHSPFPVLRKELPRNRHPLQEAPKI